MRIQTLVLLAKIICVIGQLTNNRSFIYSHQFTSQLNQTQPLWAPLLLHPITQNNLVFISTSNSVISVINQLGNQILFYKNVSDDFISCFQVSQNGQLLIIGYEKSFALYELGFNLNNANQINMQKFDKISEVEFSLGIQRMVFDEKNDLLLIAGRQGLINAYDLSDKSHVHQIGTHTIQNAQIDDMYLSTDGNWLCVSSTTFGLNLFQVQKNQFNNNRTFNEVAYSKYGNYTNYCQITSDIYVFCFDNWLGLFFANFQSILQSIQNQFPIQITFQSYWPFFSKIPAITQMIINQSETLLFLGTRSKGIYIIDISKRPKFIFVQQIKLNHFVGSLKLSIDEQYLYFSDGSSLFTFQKQQKNLNNNFPNLFNIHQAKYDEFMPGAWKWRCYIDQNNSYFIGAFDVSGLFVFPFHQNPYRLNISNYLNYPIIQDSLQLEPTGKYMIVPEFFTPDVVGVYQYNPIDDSPDQSDISLMNMKLVKSYPANLTQVSEMMTFSYDRTFAVQSFATGLILYNSTSIFDMYVYIVWQNPDFMVGENQGACITKDNQWVLSTIRLFGVYLLNVQNKTNPILSDYLIDLGGESVFISESYSYAYLVDLTKGFAIIDTTYFPKIKVISRVPLEGYVIMALPLQNEEYILITQEEKGMLTLIDMRDKKNPYVVNTIIYQSQTSQAVCMPKSQDYIFLTISSGILTMPLQSDVQIHTDANLITFDHNQRILSTPSFFSFDVTSQKLTFTVDQSLLGNIQQPINSNIILLWTVIPLDKTSFIYIAEDSYDLGVTNSTQSAQIYQYLLDQNVLNTKGIVNNQYDFNKNFLLDSDFQSILIDPSTMDKTLYQQIISQITLKINISLKKSCYMNPIRFYVIPSLTFDASSSKKFISTNQLGDIQIILQIDDQVGKFLLPTQTSVALYMSAKQDQLKIEGPLNEVNKILQQQIIFANNTIITNQISPNITITIVDNINCQLIETLFIVDCKFIKLKGQLQINTLNNLQTQLNQQYPQSVISIESYVKISFSSSTFYVSDSQIITYKCYYLNKKGAYELLSANFWLQQQNNKLSFKGSSTSNMYGEIYKFKIVAFDGYTQAEDEFQISITGLPFTYVLNLLLEILGPLLGLFGAYKKRFVFYNIIFKNKIKFSEERVFCGQLYRKEIIILGRVQEVAQSILLNLQKEIFLQQRSKLIKEINQIDNQIIKAENQSSDCSESVNDKENQINFVNEETLKINSKTYKKSFEKFLQNFKKMKKHSPKTLLEQKYMGVTGDLIFSNVVEDILRFSIFPNQNIFKSKQEFIGEIKNQNSRIHKAVRAQISRQLLSLDLKTYEIYQFIKTYCIQNIQKNKNDWFKGLVSIEYNNKENKEQKSIFPKLKLKCEVLFEILKILQLFSDKNDKYVPKNFKQMVNCVNKYQADINIFLLREVIFADTFGFQGYMPSNFNPALGQSIHLNSYEISQVIAFKEKKINKWLKPLYRLLKIEYTKYGLFKNMRLPSWIYLDQRHGKIIFRGIPTKLDVEQIQIRIYDISGYVIQEFSLNIQTNFQKSYQRLELINNIFNNSEIQDEQNCLLIDINQQKNQNYRTFESPIAMKSLSARINQNTIYNLLERQNIQQSQN
ncbi:calpain family cysteine protease (macronuclear) [Tetrahymena thermophila SB210]|uniref:Calpain family cysteine protease n=1 Tax=Tetrahymena thermophila (strain SB210) TaxID=312017 RepID=Q22ZE8_TETTS|nr:calpain family cysteine protease [Tetrahymena thermophila SB210]EAR90373.2 calpain family cysteine protease [Tetrahymena thermophila SB210]|eukprot:XP_001010618.2 calpain family cysteine protease [Tetrahymena thermophila SB210]